MTYRQWAIGVVAALALGLVLSPAVRAQGGRYGQVLSQDMAGAKDHPWTGRYAGSFILLQSVAAFDEFIFPAGKAERAGGKHFSKTARAEGRLTRTVYVTAPGRSSLEVFRNFQNQLQGQGFAAAFQCAGADGCGEPFKELKYSWNDKAGQVGGSAITGDRGRFVQTVFDGARDIRYALMRKGDGEKAAYVGLYVALNQGGTFGDVSSALNQRVTALVEVLEPKAMEARIETVASDSIAASLRSGGTVALYGLLFDTDQAVLKPQSDAQLAEMVKYLRGGAMKVYVVGHTDNQGALDYNLGLSDRRAKAVAAALAARGIPAARIAARGVGPLAPAASNADEAGRAKNRRVELVLQ
jgi:outer membrane protein OmpA-like peptidoglycan-associated protein